MEKTGTSSRRSLLYRGVRGALAGVTLGIAALAQPQRVEGAPQQCNCFWLISGNTGTSPDSNFLGTIDQQPLVVRTNNLERLRIGSDGNVGIGTTSPSSKLIVAGVIESASGGIKFPDGSVQLSAGGLTGDGFLGTKGNVPFELRVNNVRALLVQPNPTSPNLVGGFNGNSVTSGIMGATIAGGGSGESPVDLNRVSGNFGTVGGGKGNSAAQYAATVGGGQKNQAKGENSTVGGGDSCAAQGRNSTVGGGQGNQATGENSTVGGGGGCAAQGPNSTVGGGSGNSGPGPNSTVGGGQKNQAKGENSTVGGGDSCAAQGRNSTVGGGSGNSASGDSATVAGGRDNRAGGDYSFVAGRKAATTAKEKGSFVFADSNDTSFNSTAANEFAVRCTGGARFVSGIDGKGKPTAGVVLAAGASAWSTISNRNLKENFAPVEGNDILKRLSDLPITQWNYKSQNPRIRHIGPMAQDFHAAFGLGEDDLSISTVDADGIALVAIQALHKRIMDLEQKLEGIDALRIRTAALEQPMGDRPGPAQQVG